MNARSIVIKMKKNSQKSKITLDKLARITQNEFTAVRKEMDHGFKAVHKEMNDGFVAVRKEMNDGLKAVRQEMMYMKVEIVDELDKKIVDMKEEIIDEVSKKTIASNDKVITKLDILLKEDAAHTFLYKRMDDKLYTHDKRITKLEEKVGLQ